MTVDLIKENLKFLKEKNINYKIKIDDQEFKNNKKEKEIIRVKYEGKRKIEAIFYDEIDPLYLLSLDKIFKDYCKIETKKMDIIIDFLSKLEPNISLKDSIINILEVFKETFKLENTDFFINEKKEIIDEKSFKINKIKRFENIICLEDKIYLPIIIDEDFLGYFLLYKKDGFDLYEYYLVNKLNDYIKKNIESSFLENKFNIILDKSLNIFTKILEARVPGAEKHCNNVYNYSIKIAKKMNLSSKKIDNLKYGSLIFDIGKIGIPENILSKKEKLSQEENEKVKKHVNNGYELLSKIPTIPEEVKKIVLYHHERWDGKGFPEGISKDKIPITAQIVGILDKYFSLIEDKPNRAKYSESKAIEIIDKLKGKNFKPELVDIFKEVMEND